MKKFFVTLIMLLVIAMPVFLTGCDKEYKASDVKALYNTILADDTTKQYFKNGEFQVTYSEPTVATAMSKSDSPLHILSLIYEPITQATSKMVFAQLNSAVFDTYIKNFSKDTISSLHTRLEKFNSTLKNFHIQKESFEKANKVNATGNFLPNLLASYNKLIDSIINLNNTFSQEYYKKVTLTSRAIDDKFVLATNDVANEIIQTRSYIAEFVFKIYVRNYTLSNPPSSVMGFYNDSYSSYLRSAINVLNKEYVSGKVGTKSDALTKQLIVLRETYTTYLADFNINLKAAKGFDYKEFFNEPSKTKYLQDLSVQKRDTFELNQNFMKTKYTARISMLSSLIDTFNA